MFARNLAGSSQTCCARSRRRFEEQFKVQAVLDEGKSIAAVTGDPELTPSVLAARDEVGAPLLKSSRCRPDAANGG